MKNESVSLSEDKEFSTGTVPASERRGVGSLVFTWIGYVFTVTIMTAGGQIAKGSANLSQSLTAVFIGYSILFVIAMATSQISMKTGLSFGLLSRFSYGNYGAKLVSLFTTITLMGWFSINCYLMGDVTHALFPAVPMWPVILIFGFLMVFSALKGQKIMNIIGMFACVAVFAVGFVAIFIGVKDSYQVYPGGIFAIEKPSTLTMTQLITIAVGSCVNGVCSWAPDLMRFSKDTKTTTSVMSIGLFLCGPFMLLIGIVGMLVYKQADISYILKEQGLLPLAFVALVANIWSTAQGNAYSSSLNLSSIFPQIKREKLLVIFGVLGTFMGLLGLYKYFGTWLSFLATAFPPMAGVVIADYVFAWRGNTPKMEDVLEYLPKWNYLGLLSYFIGLMSSFVLPNFGITAINVLIIAFVAQTIFSLAILRKKADEIKTKIAAE